MRAVRISAFGGPEVLELVEDAPVPEPGDGQVLVRVSRAGINFADTHARDNSYLSSYEVPLIPGAEVAGEVDGRRVAALVGTGGYAEYAVAAAGAVFPLPDAVSDAAALALLIQGLSAWHLLRTSAKLAEGESVVVHAAAGGVGSLAVQLAKRFGAGRVIATASSEDKRGLARELRAGAAVVARASQLAAGAGPSAGRRCGRPTRARGSTSCSRWRAATSSTSRCARSRRSAGSWSTAWARARATTRPAARCCPAARPSSASGSCTASAAWAWSPSRSRSCSASSHRATCGWSRAR